jgi:hypothetical protein
MKRVIFCGVLLAALSAVAQQPLLTLKQQIDLAGAQQVLAIEVNKLQAIPGYKEQMAKVQTAQQKLLTMQDIYCQSKDGKKYHLEHDGGIWSCRETK